MRALIAIAGREVVERWPLLPLALVLGIVPLVAPLEGIGNREAIAAINSISSGVIAALLTGFSVLGRDLGSGRLGFFFSRPLAWWTIWGGKILGAFLLSAGTFLLAMLPAFALRLGLGHVLRAFLYTGSGVFLAATGLSLIGIGHLASVAWRSRSNWILLDLALLAAILYAGRRLFFDLLFEGAIPRGGWAWALITTLLALAVLVPSAVQLAVARTDLRRGRRILSLTLWPLVLPLLGGVWAYGQWVHSAGPSDLKRVFGAFPAPTGPWVGVWGPARAREMYFPLLLLNVETGAWTRLGTAFHGVGPAFSANGRRVAWLRYDGWRSTPGALWLADLPSVPRRVPLSLPARRLYSIALSPDGSRLAILQEDALTLADAATGAVGATVPISPPGSVGPMLFLDDNRLRAFRREEAEPPAATGAIALIDVEAASGRWEIAGRVPRRGFPGIRQDRSGERLLVVGRQQPLQAGLYEARGGRPLATLMPSGAVGFVDADFLDDGRIALVESQATTRLRVFSSDGVETSALTLVDTRGPVRLAGEPAPGLLNVALRRDSGRFSLRGDTLLVDVRAGRVTRMLQDLSPVLGPAPLFPGGPVARPAPGSSATRLFLDGQGALVEVDPVTGERRDVLPMRRAN